MNMCKIYTGRVTFCTQLLSLPKYVNLGGDKYIVEINLKVVTSYELVIMFSLTKRIKYLIHTIYENFI